VQQKKYGMDIEAEILSLYRIKIHQIHHIVPGFLAEFASSDAGYEPNTVTTR
jgi:hypothetical protein